MALEHYGPYRNRHSGSNVYSNESFLNSYQKSEITQIIEEQAEALVMKGHIKAIGNDNHSLDHKYRQNISFFIFEAIVEQNNRAEEWQIQRKVLHNATMDDVFSALISTKNIEYTHKNACDFTLRTLVDMNTIVFEDNVYSINFDWKKELL